MLKQNKRGKDAALWPAMEILMILGGAGQPTSSAPGTIDVAVDEALRARTLSGLSGSAVANGRVSSADSSGLQWTRCITPIWDSV